MMAEYFQSKKIKEVSGTQHGFFTKCGGVSKGIYDSLNCGPSSDDVAENVVENRRRVMSALDLEDSTLYGLHQIHSTKVYHVTPDMPSDEFPKGDALVANQKGVALSVLGADCTPILFADSHGVIGAAHAGWRGSVTGIVEAVVEEMCKLGAERADIKACIGPTIHQPSYEVREDFIKQLVELSSIPTEAYLKEDHGKNYFDLPSYLLEQCQRSGIQSESLGLDTYELEDQFFSFRRNTHQGIKDYGRQISLICLV